jgi:hypothetical protein
MVGCGGGFFGNNRVILVIACFVTRSASILSCHEHQALSSISGCNIVAIASLSRTVFLLHFFGSKIADGRLSRVYGVGSRRLTHCQCSRRCFFLSCTRLVQCLLGQFTDVMEK